MCTTITRLHRTCQHPTRGTTAPPEWLTKCAWARRQGPDYECVAAVRDHTTAIALDSEAGEYCDRCLIYGANLCREKGMDPDVYVRSHGNSLAAILEFAPPGGSGVTWSEG